MTTGIGYLFSGQGAQAVGMGKDLAARDPEARALYDEVAALREAIDELRLHEAIDAALDDGVALRRERRDDARRRGGF